MKPTTTLTKAAERSFAALVSPQAQSLITMGQAHGWPFAVLGQAPLPTRPVRLGDWLLSPIEQDSSRIPERAVRRVQALYAAGFRPKGFVLVHEAPRQLAAPPRPARPPLDTQALARQLRSALTVTGQVAGATAIAGAIVLGGLVSLVSPLMLLLGAAIVDPILVAVTENNDWVEIDRWFN